MSAQQNSHGSNQVDQDEIIGVAAIDLSSLSTQSTLSGYYNIVDAVGRINGQIKVMSKNEIMGSKACSSFIHVLVFKLSYVFFFSLTLCQLTI